MLARKRLRTSPPVQECEGKNVARCAKFRLAQGFARANILYYPPCKPYVTVRLSIYASTVYAGLWAIFLAFQFTALYMYSKSAGMYEKPTSMNRNLSTKVSGKNPRVYCLQKPAKKKNGSTRGNERIHIWRKEDNSAVATYCSRRQQRR